MAYIGVQPADAYTSFAVQHFTTSATTSYTLDNPVANENEIALFINNVRQEPGSSYAYTASGTTLTLSAATSASDTMYCVFIGKAVQTVTPASGSVTNDMLSGSIESSKLAFASYPYRNLIINGDMSIAQRGTSASGLTGSGYNTCDRWRVAITDCGTWTMSQDTNVPTGQGFAYSQKWQCTTAKTPLASNSLIYINHRIEAQNLTQLKYGTSNAESMTVSFWVKSNKTGTYSLLLLQRDNSDKMLTKTYTINSADTWEKKTITIPSDTSGVINNDNGEGIGIYWILSAGSSKTSGSINETWSAYTSSDEADSSQVNLADSTSNYINITGVQLEVGTSASDFEFLPYDVNLRRCERYTRRLGDGLWGKASSTTNMIIQAPFFSPMRATPSISAIASAIKTSDVTAADYTSSTGITGANINAYGARLGCSNFSGLTSGNMYILYDNSSYIALIDAEL